jgi:hypothetical protein
LLGSERDRGFLRTASRPLPAQRRHRLPAGGHDAHARRSQRALEFDGGRDLIWRWSAWLPPGSAYRCPLPHWRHREALIVARSGTARLGRRTDEERPVLADHQAAIGGPAPARVVRAWLIAVGCVQMGEGRREFRRLERVDGAEVVRVLGAPEPAGA